MKNTILLMSFALLTQISILAGAGYKLVETSSQFNEIDKNTGGSIVMFSAPWCGPCKQMEPILSEAAQTYSDISFYKINTDKPELSKFTDEYQIRGLPTTVFIYNGEEINRVSGGLRKIDLENEISNFIKKINDIKNPKPQKETPNKIVETVETGSNKVEEKKEADITNKNKNEETIKTSTKVDCEKTVILTESNWNKIKEIIEGLNKPEYKALLDSAKTV